MNSLKLISLIGFIKPKIKGQNVMLYSNLQLVIKLEINHILANYYNFTNKKMSCLQIKLAFNTEYNGTQTNLDNITCVMKLASLLSRNLAWPKPLYLLNSGKSSVSNWSFQSSWKWYSLILHKNEKILNTKVKLDQKFELTLKKFKILLLKIVFKNTQKLTLFFNQKIKQVKKNQNNISFFIKTINLKILNSFNFFGVFFSLLNFFQKITYFMSRQPSFLKLFFHQLFKSQQKNQITKKLLNGMDVIFFKNKRQALISKLYLIFDQVFKQKNLGDFSHRSYSLSEKHNTLCFYSKWLKKHCQQAKLESMVIVLRSMLLCKYKQALEVYNMQRIFSTTNLAGQNFWPDLQIGSQFAFGQAKTFGQLSESRRQKFKTNIINHRVDETVVRKKKATFVKPNKWGLTKQNYKTSKHHLRFPFRKLGVLSKPWFVNITSVIKTTMQYIKFNLYQLSFFRRRNTFFSKIHFLFLKLASYVQFFLHKVLWKWAKKQHTRVSYKFILNKYWIFIQKSAKFYFFEKSKIKV